MKMNARHGVVAIAFSVLLFFPCFSPTAWTEGTAHQKTTMDDVDREVRDAVRAIGAYSDEQRQEAVKRVKSALRDLDAQIAQMEDRLEKKWDQMDRSARKNAREALKAVRQQRNELAEWYGGMKYTSARAWDHVRKGFLDSYESLADAFNKAEKEFDTGEEK